MAAATPDQILTHADYYRTAIETHLSALPPLEPLLPDLHPEITIYLRTRPLLPSETSRGEIRAVLARSNELWLCRPEFSWKGPGLNPQRYTADGCFGEEVQNEEVYQVSIKPLINIALGGGVGSVFAYGQTGTGKTFTMTGVQERVARDVFGAAREKGDIWEFFFSAFEMLGGEVRDLLNEREGVKVLENRFGEVEVVGLKEFKVSSEDEYREKMTKASAFRATEATSKNDTSSRSHAVYRLRVKNTRLKFAEDGLLFLLDLAGSESTRDSKHFDKARLAETREINTSLMTLKQCICNRAIAADPTQPFVHIPYRSSRLTVLLKDAFELSSTRLCRTVVLAHVSPIAIDASHSSNTLKYAAPLKVPPPPPPPNDPDNPATWTNQQARDWVGRTAPGLEDALVHPEEAGIQLAKLTEAEFTERCLSTGTISEMKAKKVYLVLWELIVDARTKKRGGGMTRKSKKAIEANSELKARMKMERVPVVDKEMRQKMEKQKIEWDKLKDARMRG